jgi:hypothetical protein
MAKVIYEIEMNAENAPMIDQVNRLLLGKGYTEEAAVPAKTEAKAAATKPPAKPTAKVEKETPATDDDEMSLADFKTAVKKAKAEHGEDFTTATLVANGAKAGDPLGRMVSAIDVEGYADVIAIFEAGPAAATEDDEEDDVLDEEESEDTSEVTADAVKVAAKAYAKEVGRDEAKEIMNSNGAATLTKIADCTAKQLQVMFKAFTA